MLICIVLSIFVENIPQKVLHSAQICCTFADEITSRDGAEVARWAHNPKVVGSNPAPATKKSRWKFQRLFFIYLIEHYYGFSSGYSLTICRISFFFVKLIFLVTCVVSEVCKILSDVLIMDTLSD